MENLSSADLDETSKTPLYIGISAVIVALVAVVIGFLGFSKASNLEKQLAEVTSAAEKIEAASARSAANEKLLNQVSASNSKLTKDVQEAMTGVTKDIKDIKRSLRSVTIQAGTALSKVEAIEKTGVKVASQPKPQTSSTVASAASGKPASTSGDVTVYQIVSGDALYKIAPKFGVTVDQIIAANPGIDANRLRIGQEINIPSN